jgi:hypothetical protein
MNPVFSRGVINLNYSFEKFENFIEEPISLGLNLDLKAKGLISPIPELQLYVLLIEKVGR